MMFHKGYLLAGSRDGVAAVGYPPQARLDGPAAMTRFHARTLGLVLDDLFEPLSDPEHVGSEAIL